MNSLFTISNIYTLQELFILTEETFVRSPKNISFEELFELLPYYDSSKKSYYIIKNNNLHVFDISKKWFKNQYNVDEIICYDVKIKDIFQNQNLLNLINKYLKCKNSALKMQIRKEVINLDYMDLNTILS